MYGVPPYFSHITSAPAPLFVRPPLSRRRTASTTASGPLASRPQRLGHQSAADVRFLEHLPVNADPYFGVHNNIPYSNTFMKVGGGHASLRPIWWRASLHRQPGRKSSSPTGQSWQHALCLSVSQLARSRPLARRVGRSSRTASHHQRRQVITSPATVGAELRTVTHRSRLASRATTLLESESPLRPRGSVRARRLHVRKSVDDGSNLGVQISPFGASLSEDPVGVRHAAQLPSSATPITSDRSLLNLHNRCSRRVGHFGHTAAHQLFPYHA